MPSGTTISLRTAGTTVALIVMLELGRMVVAAEGSTIQATSGEIIIRLAPSVSSTAAVAVYELAPNEPDDAWRHKKPFLVRRVSGWGRPTIAFPRFEDGPSGRRDRIYSKFVVVLLGRPHGRKADPLMAARFVEDMKAASRRTMPFPEARSKKGLQVEMTDDALSLGISHATLNVFVSDLFAWKHHPDDVAYEVDGRTFYFDARSLSALDRRVKALSRAGVIVTLVLLNRYAPGNEMRDRVMVHPRYDPACPNHYSAFNTVTDEGLAYFKAAIEFIVDRYTRPDRRFGLALNYIVGNEVNSHWWWTNMGRVSMEEYVEDYLRTVRVATTAAKKICSAARVYISLDHHWATAYGDDEKKSFAAKPFIDLFAKRARQQGNFPWNLAFHAYPENLRDPATWLDKTALDSFDTPVISFKNIEILPAYFRRPQLLYGGRPRHIILSEQGFHAKDGEEGETLQAAAFCYAYYKVAHLEGIDAFILYRHVDHAGEAGLRYGLWAREKTTSGARLRKRKIYDVFKLADTPRWREAFAFAMPIIGIRDWSELLTNAGQNPATTPASRTGPTLAR